MFGNKKREIQELEKKIQDLLPRKSEFNDTIKYLDSDVALYRDKVTKHQALLYIQKIICNSIIYNDYAYTILRNPNTAPKLNLNDFLPTSESHNFEVKDVGNNLIYLPSDTTPFITFPWNNKRVIDDIFTIGKDARNPFDNASSNIDNIYIYPLGIVLVGASGNHSQLIGLLKGEMNSIRIDHIYDISTALKETSDYQLSNFHGSRKYKDTDSIKDKWISLMTVGRYLIDDPNFPPQILSELKK